MRLLLSLLILFSFQQNTFANTQGFFGTPDKAVVLVQGQVGDKDAPGVFQSMRVPAVADGEFFKKTVTYTTVSNTKVLDLICKISKSIQMLGSCTMVLYKSPWTAIGAASVALIFARNKDAENISLLFAQPDETGRIFGSADGKLSIRSDKDATNKKSFTIWYR